MKMVRIQPAGPAGPPDANLAGSDANLAGSGTKRRSLHDELLERLRELIVHGDLPPGDKVPERELCERFSVSRTPMREALKVLASEGLVTLRPNRGAVVSALTIEELDEAFPVMAALEKLTGELAVREITDAEIAHIGKLHHEMVARYEQREIKPYFVLNEQIHEAILDAARNPTLAGIHRGLAGRVRRARYLAHMSEARWARAIAEHELILEAVNARAPRLGQILKDHLKQKFETVREALLH